MYPDSDRRVRRTKELLHVALIELMIERGYDRVTVQDILDRADVGRSTFYAHFRDKDDLLATSSTEYVRAAVANAPAPTGPDGEAVLLAPAFTLFRLAAEYPQVYRTLVGPKSSGALLRTNQQMCAAVLTDHLTGRLDLDEDEFSTTVTALSWAIVGILGEIATTDPPMPPREAFHRLQLLVGDGLRRHIAPSSRRTPGPSGAD